MTNKILDAIPQRYVLGVMGFFATTNTYAMRVVMNIAITQMTLQQAATHVDPNSCPGDEGSSSGNGTTTHINDPVYDWSESTKGLILSSFFYGYIVTHLPGGMLAEKWGGKHTLGIGILIGAVMTALTPWILTATDGNWKILMITRVFIGFGQGTSNPAINSLLAKWVPLKERATIGTLVFGGSQMGTIICSAICGALIHVTKSWASVFYLFGGLGILWYILWQILCYSSPEQHPFIGEKEKNFLKKEIEGISTKKPNTPWKAMLTSAPVWALVAAQAGHDWGFFTILTELPTYMSEVLKFNIKDNGLWNSLPYIVMWVCSLSSGKLCDWMIAKGYIKVTLARKIFTTLAAVGPSIFIMAASYAGCDKALTVGMFTISLFLTGPFYCGFKVNALDIAPNHAGILMAIVNGLGSITGCVVPYLAGALTEDHTLLQWRLVFWITGAVYVVTSIIFCIWGSGELQLWNDLSSCSSEDKYPIKNCSDDLKKESV
ncbi:putative inorganic phosphate cotransporter [Diabrotica undecimpunctata]|uniref:putative inorganic phosphate cotransporter n=1 Tax=Diabrotica undecimpunctata TaxID=50387 RepID=UPI003B6410A1